MQVLPSSVTGVLGSFPRLTAALSFLCSTELQKQAMEAMTMADYHQVQQGIAWANCLGIFLAPD